MNSPNQLYHLVAPDVKLGQRVKLYAFTNLYGCEIGDESRSGNYVEIQQEVRFGTRCVISSDTLIREGVNLADAVLVGREAKLGESPTVGAGSVVAGDVLADAVVADTPAQASATLTARSF